MVTPPHTTAVMPEVFYPQGSLEGKKNFKRYVYIDPDDSITERVYLNILDKRQREEVICAHFLQLLVRHFVKVRTGVNILSRDAPWDFRLELSTGVQFNLEIVSVADNDTQFKVLSREEARDKSTYEALISLRQLRKLAHGFPNEALELIIEEHVQDGRSPDDLVPNPHFGEEDGIYVSCALPPDGSLDQRIDNAIRSKEAKNGGDKEKTILIIDNRTSVYFVDDVIRALTLLEERISSSPFLEIWFYNGYCSDWDGRNGEYTFIAVKVAGTTAQIFSSAAGP